MSIDEKVLKTLGAYPLSGVRFNVIRRPAHKSVESALKKFHEDEADGRIGEWFARFRCEISPADVAKFRRECLDPILEQLCVWWEHVTCETGKIDPFDSAFGFHWRHPFGVYNSVDETGWSDVDSYLESGSEVGLQRVDELFPELK